MFAWSSPFLHLERMPVNDVIHGDAEMHMLCDSVIGKVVRRYFIDLPICQVIIMFRKLWAIKMLC